MNGRKAASAAEKALAWDAARNALNGRVSSDLSLQDLAATVGRPWRYRSRSKRVRDLLAMNWEELNTMWFLGERKPTALLEIIEAAVTNNVLEIIPARSPKPFTSKEEKHWQTIRKSLSNTVFAHWFLCDLAEDVGLGWPHPGGDRPLSDFLSGTWKQVLRILGPNRARSNHFFRVLDEVERRDIENDVWSMRRNDTSYTARFSDSQISEAWDQARIALFSQSSVDLSLSEFSRQTGFRWKYSRGEVSICEFLEKSWHSLGAVRGFGDRETRKIFEIVCAASRSTEDSESTTSTVRRSARKDVPNIRAVLMDLSIEPHTTVDMLFFSSRAKWLLREKGLKNLGEFLDFLEITDRQQLCVKRGVGTGTAREVFGLFDALKKKDIQRLRKFLPIRATGAGLSFTAAAACLFEGLSQQNRVALFNYLGEGKTLREAAQLSGRTTAHISNVASSFKQGLDRFLSHFTTEKHTLWKSWERCEQMEYILEGELDVEGRSVVAGALRGLFAVSDEGKAILEHRTQLFASLWKEVRQSPEFYGDGFRVTGLLRQNGQPYLLMPFLDYLEHRHHADVSRTFGKVKARTRLDRGDSLRCRIVDHLPRDEIVEEGGHQVNKDEILRKLAAGELSTEEASKLLDSAIQEQRRSLHCKVSQKGAISVYGLQRMPVTLYAQQWERLLDFGDEIRAFMKENNSQLSRKEG